MTRPPAALIGHRGCAGQYPENTVAAIERAAPHVDAVEIDVRRCATGELVVFHDAELDRLTAGTGLVSDAAWSDLRELTVLDSGEPIPLLADALAAAPAGTAVNVEIKESGVAADALAVARSADAEVWFSSFRPGVLESLRELDPDADLALLVADADVDGGRTVERVKRVIDRAVALDCVAIHPEIDLATEPGFVAAANEAGLGVNAWTVTDRADAERLLDAGVDGIIADRWDVLGDAARPSRS
ncbi:glycerophosphodiester phosphodiesterase [Halorubrum salipaludis]|uniref:Glycerophosphodiester phosphodiesterase n=1 Tax=Halorubrum salipaludis TaxID=2032630 RepID=A0A2A2FIM2_9EURY|nr:glycerophosphodiester phosphodiesterase [Halorubrum salipaludis]PAU84720.1 glycerophosphodiester phosphodiesterase [Halorubrum salipaludis]